MKRADELYRRSNQAVPRTEQDLLCCCQKGCTIRMRCTLFLPSPSAANARLWLGLNRVPGPPSQFATGPKVMSPVTSTDNPATIPGMPRAGASISATCRVGFDALIHQDLSRSESSNNDSNTSSKVDDTNTKNAVARASPTARLSPLRAFAGTTSVAIY